MEPSWNRQTISLESLAPASIQFPIRTIALPLIGAGDQGYNPEAVLEPIVLAAAAWLKRGLPVETIKIVIYSTDSLPRLEAKFLSLQAEDSLTSQDGRGEKRRNSVDLRQVSNQATDDTCDLFFSYSRKDGELARLLMDTLITARPSTRVFFDVDAIRTGTSWLTTIANALDSAKRVVTLYSPQYWLSLNCRDEFNGAFIRQKALDRQVLFPIYLHTTHIPFLFQSIQYFDCREGDQSKFSAAAMELSKALDESRFSSG